MRVPQPFSLVRRITALVVGVSIVTLILHSALLVLFVKPLGDELVVRIAVQVRSLAAALAAVPTEDRNKLAAAVGKEGVSVSRTRPSLASHGSAGFDEMPRSLLDMLDEKLGRRGTSEVTIDRDGKPSLSVAVEVGSESWWVTFPNARPPPIAWTLLPILSAAGLLASAAVLALVIGVRLITRPMSQLAHDMLARRYELRQIDEPVRVSIELQGVIRSFNSLVHAVELSAQSRRNLLVGVSHDLRTPLARLRLRAETECSEEIALRMETDFLAMSRIIDQFLAYAQGQNGVAIGELHPIDDLAEEVVEQYRADGADVALVRHGSTQLSVPDLGTQRALVNLIDNARAHGRGPVQVELWAEDQQVFLVVYDHGPGIAEGDLERALQPFVRFGASQGQGGHCGLGLAIVAQIAEQLGGRPVLKPFDGRRSGVGVVLPT